MSGFRVGDICTIIGGVYPMCIGDEVEILALPGCSSNFPDNYKISKPPNMPVWGEDYLAPASCLRKKKPKDPPEMSDWQQVETITGWNPIRERQIASVRRAFEKAGYG